MAGRLRDADGAQRRRAAELLLAWGFTPRSIARELGCSTSWVYEVRRRREESGGATDVDAPSIRLLAEQFHR